jgi:hypothetical protein
MIPIYALASALISPWLLDVHLLYSCILQVVNCEVQNTCTDRMLVSLFSFELMELCGLTDTRKNHERDLKKKNYIPNIYLMIPS